MQHFLSLFVPLLIIMDPVGNLPLFLTLTQGLDSRRQMQVAVTACVTAALILLLFGLTGDGLLRFFGITVPAFQLAGGIIFFLYALQMFNLISPPNLKTSAAEAEESLQRDNIAIVPLAIPLLAGPGAITVVVAWQQDPARQIPLGLLALVIVSACTVTCLTFLAARLIRKLLGLSGIGVITRLTGLLLAVIAMQFIIEGLSRVLQP